MKFPLATLSKGRKSVMKGKTMYRLDGLPHVNDWEDWGFPRGIARRLVACWNVLIDEDLSFIEGLLKMDLTYRKHLENALTEKQNYMIQLNETERAIEKSRKEILEAIDELPGLSIELDRKLTQLVKDIYKRNHHMKD